MDFATVADASRVEGVVLPTQWAEAERRRNPGLALDKAGRRDGGQGRRGACPG